MLLQQQIEHIVALSRAWADRSPDRILLEERELEPEVRRQVALQVSLLTKMQRKVPLFTQRGGYIPHRVNFEQCSSELAATYKSQLIAPHERILDMTGGLGIDAIAMATVSDRSVIYEIDPTMAHALTYNLLQIVPQDKATVRCGDALAEMDQVFIEGVSLVYADPSRRDLRDPNRRISCMDDYSPSPRQIIRRLQELDYRGRLLLKLSPMLDIQWILTQIPLAYEIHIVQVQDEVKELLVFVSMVPQAVDVKISLIMIDSLGEIYRWSFPYYSLSKARTSYATQLNQYIHIPQPVLMKSGAYHLLAQERSLTLLGPDTHIYTSPEMSSLPLYKSYRLLKEIDYSKSTLRGRSLQALRQEYPAVTIMSRHFPLSAQQLKQLLKTDESDRYYLLATTLGTHSRKLLLLTT